MYLFEKQLNTLCLLTLFLLAGISTIDADAAADIAALPADTPADVTGLTTMWGRIKTILLATPSALDAATMDSLWNATMVGAGFETSIISDQPLYQLILDTLTLMSNPKFVTSDSQQAITDFIASTPGFAGLTPSAPPAGTKPAASKPATSKPATSKSATSKSVTSKSAAPVTTTDGQTKSSTLPGTGSNVTKAKKLGRIRTGTEAKK